MNTKKALKILKIYKSTLDDDICNKENEELDNIIELLKHGEKYKQMWKEFKLINREYFSNFEIRANYIIRMEDLEQKWFSKGEINE